MVDGRECVITVVRDDGLGERNPRFRFDGERWRIPSDGLENFGGVAYEVTTQAYAQYDGSYLLNERVPERDRTISADAWFDPAEARAEAEAFFIPHREYEVHCTYRGRTRYFRGVQYALDLSTGSVWARQSLTWTCLALDPMWLSEDEKRFDIAEAAGLFGFPFMSLAEAYTVDPEADEGEDGPGSARASGNVTDAIIKGFAVGAIAHEIEMENAGTAAAYPRFDVSATGEVVNPVIAITDSSGAEVCRIGFDLTLEDGDELTVDFSTRPTSILLNGANASQHVTSGSTLATGIEVGRFTLSWSAEDGDAALSIKPSIRERYASS